MHERTFLTTELKIDILAFFLIVAAVVAVFHGLVLGEIIVSSDVGTNDLLYFNYPVGKIYGEALRHRELLQWTPYIYGGFPVFAEGQGGFLYPINAVLWWLLKPVAAMNVYIMLHAVMMGMGTYLFAGSITRSKRATLPAGIVAAVCGSIVVGHVRHLNPLAVIALMPWLFWIGEVFIQRSKWWLAPVFGSVMALMIFAGHPNFAVIASALAGMYVLLRRYITLGAKQFDPQSHVPPTHLQLLAFFGIAGAVAVAIALPQILSTIELMGFSRRLTDPGTGFSATLGSMAWNGVMTFIYPYINGNPADGSLDLDITKPLFFTEGFAYCGVLIFALAIFGAIWGWKRSGAVRALSIIAVVSYLLALGSNFVLHRVLLLIPVLKSFRFPVRWLLGTEFAVLSLSAFGVIGLATMLVRFRKTRSESTEKSAYTSPGLVFALIIAAVGFADIYYVLGRHVATDSPNKYLTPSLFAQRLQTLEGSGKVYALGKFQMHTAAYFGSKGWEGDRSLYELHTKLLPPNLSAAHRIPIMNGYAILAPNYLYKIWGDANGQGFCGDAFQFNEPGDSIIGVHPAFLNIAHMSGLRYVITPWQLPTPFVKVWDTVEAKSRTYLYAYEIPDRFPRAWIVPDAMVVPEDSTDLAVQMITAPDFDPSQTAIVSGTAPTRPDGAAAGSVEILSFTNESIRLRASVPGLVVLSDTWYPRWKATVDGVSTPVLRVNSYMRGVVAPKAGAVIQMRYDSKDLGIMLPISAILLILSFGFAMYMTSKQR